MRFVFPIVPREAPRNKVRRRVLKIALVMAALLASPGPGPRAQEALRAAAVVNDEVISMLDLVMRTRLAILGAKIEDTPEVRRRIAQQVLLRLVDEQLQLQEAERLAIEVPERQIDDALRKIAERNNMSSEIFLKLLNDNAVLPFAVRDQIKAELAWRAIVELRIKPSVEIQEDEIEDAIEQIRAQNDQYERRVAEIFLSVPDIREEEAVIENAQQIIEQVRGGASFYGLAREFSQSRSAQLGGDLGWVELGELEDVVAPEVRKLRPGEVSPPIRTPTGVAILYLDAIRERDEEAIDRAAIRERLIQQRLDLMAQRSLQDLRRKANIDIRI